MPTVLRVGPYQFKMYASDIQEPPHVHATRDRSQAKFWLEPAVRLSFNRGFARHELNQLRQIIIANREFLLEQWHGFFPNP